MAAGRLKKELEEFKVFPNPLPSVIPPPIPPVFEEPNMEEETEGAKGVVELGGGKAKGLAEGAAGGRNAFKEEFEENNPVDPVEVPVLEPNNPGADCCC